MPLWSHCGALAAIVGLVCLMVVTYNVVYNQGMANIHDFTRAKLSQVVQLNSPELNHVKETQVDVFGGLEETTTEDSGHEQMENDKSIKRRVKELLRYSAQREEELKDIIKGLEAELKLLKSRRPNVTGPVTKRPDNQIKPAATCVDEIINCHHYPPDICTDKIFAMKNCRKSCYLCPLPKDNQNEVAADKDLDPETLKWKRLLHIPVNSSVINNVRKKTNIDWETFELFNRTVFEKKDMDFIFRAFDIWLEIATEEKIPWMIAEGSLLGSYRNHGMIPWDGDIDVIMDMGYKEILTKAFQRKNYTDYRINHAKAWSKIHPVNGHKPKGRYPWRAPFVDVFYWKQNSTHVWGKGFFAKTTSDVFPLTKRPFQGRMVFGPHDPRRILTRSFPKDHHHGPTGTFISEHECRGNEINYLREMWISKQNLPTVPCNKLLDKYPFVRHIRGEGGAYCKEELVMKGKVLNVFYRNATGIPVC